MVQNKGSMKRVFVVHGMKRSGNHAIINWLIAHDHFIFYNDVIQIAPILNGKKKIPPPQDFTAWFKRRRLPRRIRFAFFIKKFILQKYSLIASLEDHSLSVKPFYNVPCEVTNILIVRDPSNLFSSRIRKAAQINHPAYSLDEDTLINRDVELWKSHAQEFTGSTNHLKNKVCIYFDAWFSNENYREQISQKLNFEFTDTGFSKISNKGGGSSFDKTLFDGNNQMMNILNRKANLKESEQQLLENILTDDDLQELKQIIISMEMHEYRIKLNR